MVSEPGNFFRILGGTPTGIPKKKAITLSTILVKHIASLHVIVLMKHANSFFKYARTHYGAAMTVRELKKFMWLEQHVELSDEDCRQIISEYEPSVLRRKSHLLSASGFSHFMVFSEMHDLIDHEQVEHVNQVGKEYVLRLLKYVFYSS